MRPSIIQGKTNFSNIGSANNVYIYKSLDIDSTYRNRNEYKNPGSFVVPVKTSGNSSISDISDPVIDNSRYTGSLIKKPGFLQIGVGSTTTNIVLDSDETTRDNFYVNSFLEINNEAKKIIMYDPITQVAVVDVPFSVSPVLGDVYYTRKALPFYSGIVNSVINNSTFTLDTTSSNIDNKYVDSYLTFTSGGNNNVTSRIVNYIGNTRTVRLAEGMTSNIQVGDTIELGTLVRNNSYALTSIAGKSIFEIQLNWISVPNQLLNVGYGGTISNYPYIYVKLYNEKSNLSSQVLYSNNPNSGSVLFKVPVNEFYGNPDFIVLKDAKSIQTVSFNFDSDLRFECCLPSGEIIQFANNDNSSPDYPNPFLQFSALFSLRKINEQL